MEIADPQKPIGTKLKPEVVLENVDLANRAPDSTKDNGPRPPEWNPPVISKDEYEAENPYNK